MLRKKLPGKSLLRLVGDRLLVLDWVRRCGGFNRGVRAGSSNDAFDLARTRGKPIVLFFGSIPGLRNHMTVDLYLAKIFVARGCEVHFISCDGVLEACHVSSVYTEEKGLEYWCHKFSCGTCSVARQYAEKLCPSIIWHKFSDFLPNKADMADESSDYDSAIFHQARAGMIRYLASSESTVISQSEDLLLPRYVRSASTVVSLMEKIVLSLKPTVALLHHGVYVPQGVILESLRKFSIPFYTWHFGYRANTLIFSKSDTYHREFCKYIPGWDKPLSPESREIIQQYLLDRRVGSQDWIKFNSSDPSADVSKPLESQRYTKTFVFFANVDWDACLHYPGHEGFSQFDLVRELLAIFESRQDYRLLIRAHPAEVTGFHKSATNLADFCYSEGFGSNVEVINAHAPISSYDLIDGADVFIVYNTKMAIELCATGIPVIVCGDSWVRDKNLSYDISRLSDLSNLIDSKLVCLTGQVERALRFAYYFYFRRCVEFKDVRSEKRGVFRISIVNDGSKEEDVFKSKFVKAALAGQVIDAESL